jgi:drug/metabolite transporter (DMT)-like permease
MTGGVIAALTAAVGFGLTQTVNRKSNLIVGPTRTAFGLLSAIEAALVVRVVMTGEWRMLAGAPMESLAAFTAAALIHYAIGWTLLAHSQEQIGVARTGAVASAAPLVATLLAAVLLDEPLTWAVAGGVGLTVLGVALVSTRRKGSAGTMDGGAFPWFGLAVAVCWGSSPIFIRTGLDGLDAPVLGLTFGLGAALVIHLAVLVMGSTLRHGSWDRQAVGWMAVGGLTGAVGIGAQWVAFGLTTIAVAFTVMQLATLIVVGLAPVVFDAEVERLTGRLVVGTVSMLVGSAIVVWL